MWDTEGELSRSPPSSILPRDGVGELAVGELDLGELAVVELAVKAPVNTFFMTRR